MKKDIEKIILEYCCGFEHLEFDYSDLPEMVEKIIESYDSRLVAAFRAGEELGHRKQTMSENEKTPETDGLFKSTE